MSVEVIRSHQECSRCGARLAVDDPRTTCSSCGGLLDVIHDIPPRVQAALRETFAQRAATFLSAKPAVEVSGVWRYRELVYPQAEASAASFPEGNTPLLVRKAISEWAGARDLRIKHEGMNPTGSFKDRGMCVAITQASRVGASAVACASTGNTSSSLAAYAGVAGIASLVLVPHGHVAQGKLAQTRAYGAHTLLVRGDFDDCLRLAREASEKLQVYLVNSINPFRIEGQKTIVFEMLQQLDWNPPDWIALPAGNLGNAAAFGKALREAKALGLIHTSPRLLLVQAEGAAPFAKSFRDGFRVREKVQAETVASAIRIGDPASFDRAVRSIRESDGLVTDVTDAEILEAKAIVDSSGVGCEPASAASVAGVRKCIVKGEISADDRIVAVLTGHVLKDQGAGEGRKGTSNGEWGSGNREKGRTLEIDASLTAVEHALRQLQ